MTDRDAAPAAAEALAERLRLAARGMDEMDRAAQGLTRSLSAGLSRAMTTAASGSGQLGEVVRGLGQDMARSALRAAVRPVGDAVAQGVGGAITGVLGAAVAGFSAGPVRAFAKGGVVERATAFPMAGGGAGVMGEAGPEAILPLARGADGRLGVRGGGGVQVTLNVTTPDAESFRRSGPQVAAELARMVERGRRRL